MIKITVLFENTPHNPELQTGWGYSCLIETEKQTILFDTGSDGVLLLENMKKLAVSPGKIQHIVISHEHWDHIGGLPDLLQHNRNAQIWFPKPRVSSIAKEIAASGRTLHTVADFREIQDNIFSLGTLNLGTPEQSVAVQTNSGLLIFTGCAHPGIANIVENAHKLFPGTKPYLIMGGFHLKDLSGTLQTDVVADLKRLRVEYVAPGYCTGEAAIKLLENQWQEKYMPVGVGSVIRIQPEGNLEVE